MFHLRPITREAIPSAIEKADHYRLLNEPAEAASICRDVLALEPAHARALVTLVLSLSDQLEEHPASFEEARALLPRLEEGYTRDYYAGILWERRAKATLRRGGPGAGARAYPFFREALEAFDRASHIAPEGNEDAILRWNTCVRLLEAHPDARPREDDGFRPLLE
jgi:hypothetical protein